APLPVLRRHPVAAGLGGDGRPQPPWHPGAPGQRRRQGLRGTAGLLAHWPGHLRGRARRPGAASVPAVPDLVAGDHRAEYLAGRQRRRLPGPEVGLAGQAAGRDRARTGRLHGVPALGLPALSRSWSTGCSGSACTVPRWPWTVWARNIELRTASSVASATAWNKGVMASLDSRCSSWRARPASRRTDSAVLKAIT